MIIDFHTPKRIVKVDTDTVTDVELAKLDMNRQKLNDYLARQPRDLEAEIDDLRAELKQAFRDGMEHGP